MANANDPDNYNWDGMMVFVFEGLMLYANSKNPKL
jgi:hypothetical protein